jgi:hypothetical protein
MPKPEVQAGIFFKDNLSAMLQILLAYFLYQSMYEG